MMTGVYIATFYSHFGAMSFKKKCDRSGFPAKIMPVPRTLSSSCGTCVKFEGDSREALKWRSEEVEQFVCVKEDGGYEVIYHADSAV